MRNAGQVSSIKKKNQCEYLLSREPARALERKGQGPSAGSPRLAPQPQNSPPRPRRPQPPQPRETQPETALPGRPLAVPGRR